MSLRDALHTVLTNDATLGSLLPGGVHAVPEITRQATPGAFDANGEVQPCGQLRLESDAPAGPFPTSARTFVVVRVYQRRGYDTLDAALARVYELLHRQRVSGERVWEIRHTGDVVDVWDQALDCALALSRYQVTRVR
jgi:hypothetical protein